MNPTAEASATAGTTPTPTPTAPATLAGLYETLQMIESALATADQQQPLSEPAQMAWDLVIAATDDAFDLLHSAGMPPGDPPVDRESTPAELAIQACVKQAAASAPEQNCMLGASYVLIAMVARAQNLSSRQRALIVGFLGMYWKHYGCGEVLARMAPGGTA